MPDETFGNIIVYFRGGSNGLHVVLSAKKENFFKYTTQNFKILIMIIKRKVISFKIWIVLIIWPCAGPT